MLERIRQTGSVKEEVLFVASALLDLVCKLVRSVNELELVVQAEEDHPGGHRHRCCGKEDDEKTDDKPSSYGKPRSGQKGPCRQVIHLPHALCHLHCDFPGVLSRLLVHLLSLVLVHMLVHLFGIPSRLE